MPKVSPIQSNFNGGEISPLLYGRVDVPRYKESLAICKNYLPLIQGPITRRPGTAFVFPVKDSTKKTRLIPFEASTSKVYVVEVGNGYMRFYQNNAIVTTNGVQTITAITKANPAVVTSNSHGYGTNDRVVITGVVGMTEVNNREFVVGTATTNTFQLLGVDSSNFTTYSSGGSCSKIYELTTAKDWDAGGLAFPYATADLDEIQFTQSNEVLYLAHPSHPPFKLTLDGNPFNLIKIPIQDGPYLPQGFDVSGSTAVFTTGTISFLGHLAITTDTSIGVNGGAGFSSKDVGRLLRLKYSSTWYWGRIHAVFGAKSIDMDTIIFPDTRPPVSQTMAAWRLGSWSDQTGWPATVVFHQDRLVFGGAGATPASFDGSNTSDYENFSPSDNAGTTAAANAYSFVLNSNDLNSINWMTSDEQGLIAGTTGGEWLITSADSQSALSAVSISAKKTTSFGSEPVQAVQAGKCTLFVQRGSRKLRELNYYFDVNGFRAADLTQLAEHITSSGIVALALQKIPQPIVWAVRSDGVLLAMTYERDLDALKVGWSRHILGGTQSDGSSSVVESVAVTTSADGTAQDVWVIVKRYVNGATVRYVEYLKQIFDDTTDVKNSFFVDSGLTYSGTATTTVSGINHLNGQIVSIIADGSPQPNVGVVSGKITLSTAASIITVGLAYNSDGQKLRTDAGSADGTAMGKTRRTHRVGIMLLNTLGFKLGPDFNSLDDITLTDNEDGNYDKAQGLYTGIRIESITTDYDLDNMFCWRQNQPMPGTIQGIYPQMVTQDRG